MSDDVKTLLLGLGIVTVVAVVVAAWFGWLAWQHNSMGEIRSEVGVDWQYLALLAGSWFLVVWTVGALVILGIYWWRR